jgi:phage gpG-like protein
MSGEIKTDLSKLNALVSGISAGYVVKVGIFGKKNSRTKDGKKNGEESSMTNAEVGAIHEFGSFERHVPQRSFLRMPLTLDAARIIQEASVRMLQLLADGKIVLVLQRLGTACEKAVERAFDSGGFGTWEKLKPSTIMRRKKHSTSILIDTSQLRRSIASKVEKA